MDLHDQADAAFKKLISHGRTSAIRKAAEVYWSSYNSDEGASEKIGMNFEQSTKSIPIDYRQPTIKHLDELNNCKENDTDIKSCYLKFAISVVDRVITLA